MASPPETIMMGDPALNPRPGSKAGLESSGAELTDDMFGVQLSSREWLIERTTWGHDEQHIHETLFTLGNGFVGSRGIFEEYPEGAMPGTYMAGVFDLSGAQVEELVNLPNPIHFLFTVEGEKLDMRLTRFTENSRILDMRQGLLARRTVFEDLHGRRFVYRSARFISMSSPRTAWMRVSLTLLNGKANVTALDNLDDSTTNFGGLVYGNRRHYRMVAVDADGPIHYHAFRTGSSKILVSYADQLTMERGGSENVLCGRVHDFELAEGQTITFTKAFAIGTSLEHAPDVLKNETVRNLEAALEKGFEGSFVEHKSAWYGRWDCSDVAIEGDPVSAKALRFSIYHLIIAGFPGPYPASIGARALTGQGYRGHVFWDSEIFMLPFYVHTHPAAARNMLLYRYSLLDPARRYARAKGFRGALYPWESARTGEEATPRWAKETDGTVLEMDTIDYEHHISADVAYGVFDYVRATGDRDFLERCGAEIIFETARFWASRVSWDEERKCYRIRDVIGPDEFHVRVDDNAFTNHMAAWNLEYARELFRELRRSRSPHFARLKEAIGLGAEEADRWRDTAAKIFRGRVDERGVIEQFDGYFQKTDIAVKNFDQNLMPEPPRYFSYQSYDDTRFNKQADTLLMMHLLSDHYDEETLRANYEFYIRRTLHQSSLSHSTHALIASELGDRLRAYAFFLTASRLDLLNIHRNSDGGMHMACVGGVWQAAVFGFGGFRTKTGRLMINPRLPGNWRSMTFHAFWQGRLLRCVVQNDRVAVTYNPAVAGCVASPGDPPTQGEPPAGQGSLAVEIFGKEYELAPFATVEAERKSKESEMKRVKDIMKKENFVCADEDASVNVVSRLMIDNQIRSVPVLDGNGTLRGMVCEEDILEIAGSGDFPNLRARDIMNKNVVVVGEDDNAELAILIFTERPVRRIPVLRDDKVVGVVTRDDVLSAWLGEEYY